MFVRRYPLMVTILFWITATLYGIYWAVQNAVWIKSTERALGIERNSKFKIPRNFLVVYFGYFMAAYLAQVSGFNFPPDPQDYLPGLRVFNTFLWFGFLSYLLWNFGDRIRNIEREVGIENQVKISTAFFLIPLFYSSGTYYQRHINTVIKKMDTTIPRLKPKEPAV
jgi:hypothetical protein